MKRRKLLRALGLLALLVVVLETALQFSPAVQFYLLEKRLHCAADFYLRLCPAQAITFHHPSGFSYTITTDQVGERITSRNPPSASDTNEIWILGDYIAMGYGVSDAESFPYLIQTNPGIFHAGAEGLHTRIRNLGVDSMGTVAMADVLQKTQGQPSYIFWPFSPSDFIDDPSELARQSSLSKRLAFRFRTRIARHSAILAMLKHLRESGRRDAYLTGSVVTRDHPTFQGILRLNQIAKDKHSRLCVVLYQDVEAGGSRPAKSDPIREDVSRFLSENSICTVDARPEFLSYNGNDLYLANDGHPAQAAQKLLADAILHFLKNQPR
ncbi:MAG: hypothetical protein K8S54_08725 [Spirochaetia bacterium]|nr:hypothetical protein [Spirochaetia bacterium]